MTFGTRGFLAGISMIAMLAAATPGARANDSLIKAQSDSNQWAVAGHDYGNTRFSPLKQINTDNAGKLTLAYSFSLASLRSNESSPIVVGNTLYVSSSWGPKYVYALDAATGARKWTYEPDIPDDVLQYACCDVNSRGVSYADGKIFVGRLDGKLTALDAATGKTLWTSKVVDYKQGSVITSPPLVVRDKVITGFGGGEYGVRGSLRPSISTPASRSGRPIPCPRRMSLAATAGRAIPPSMAAVPPGWSAPTMRRATRSIGAPAIPDRGTRRCARPAMAISAS